MPKNQGVDVNVDIGIGAKAEIKTEVPAEVTGNLVDALTDIIRPFSEKRGLKADILRLQREDVLIEIAKKAHRRMAIEGAPIEPIPQKFLVPFLERASLEDSNDTVMVDLWSNLLASAAGKTSKQNNRFISILEEINGNQALILKSILCSADGAVETLERVHDTISQSETLIFLNAYIRQNDADDIESLGALLVDYFNKNGLTSVYIGVSEAEVNINIDFAPDGQLYRDDIILDFEILESLFLVRRREINSTVSVDQKGVEFEYTIVFYSCTYLALELLEACSPDCFKWDPTRRR